MKCQHCGFLSVRDFQTRILAEVEKEMRDTGQSPTSWSNPTKCCYERTPICFVRAFDLPQEAGKNDDKDAFLKVIQTERDCPAFDTWKQGSTPKEHKAMIDSQKQQEWQRKIETEDREYRDNQRRLDLEHREKESRAASWRFSLQILITIILAVIAIVTERLLSK